MLRKSPLNHLAAAVLALLVWTVAVIWGAAYLADAVPFQGVFPEDFQRVYRWVMTALALLAIAQLSYWFAYGARETTATQLPRAKRVWVTTWLVQLLLSAVSVVAIAMIYLGQLFEPAHYAVMFALASLQTWGAFWIATVLMSPRPVQYVPWGKG